MGDDFNEAKWFDRATTASRPGGIAISYPRLEWFRRKLNWGHRYLGVGQIPPQRWAVHLQKGLAEPALLISAKPLLVAVYTDEFDCVVMLRFAAGLPPEIDVREGERLLSVNTFESPPPDLKGGGTAIQSARSATSGSYRRRIERDLIGGAAAQHSAWYNVHPAIADFLSEDAGALAARKNEIRATEWARLEELSAEYRTRFPRRYREGNPYLSHLPAK